MNAELLARAARKWGHETQSLVDPKLLPDLIKTMQPHVLTLDLRMGGTTGSDVLMMLGACDYTGDIIIISGLDLSVLETVKHQALAMGLKVVGTLRKPVNLNTLRDILANVQRVREDAVLSLETHTSRLR
jgi:CheY-like chemotaxis protein